MICLTETGRLWCPRLLVGLLSQVERYRRQQLKGLGIRRGHSARAHSSQDPDREDVDKCGGGGGGWKPPARQLPHPRSWLPSPSCLLPVDHLRGVAPSPRPIRLLLPRLDPCSLRASLPSFFPPRALLYCHLPVLPLVPFSSPVCFSVFLTRTYLLLCASPVDAPNFLVLGCKLESLNPTLGSKHSSKTALSEGQLGKFLPEQEGWQAWSGKAFTRNRFPWVPATLLRISSHVTLAYSPDSLSLGPFIWSTTLTLAMWTSAINRAWGHVHMFLIYSPSFLSQGGFMYMFLF